MTDPGQAVLRERADPAAPGMGLWLVAKIAQVWGCSRSLSGGKVVWAVLKERGPPPSRAGG